MRRSFLMIFILILAVSCARVPFSQINPTPLATFTSQPESTVSIPQALTPTLSPSSTPGLVTFTPAFTPTPTYLPANEQFTVLYHPDDVLYVGDQVSLEVISPPGLDLKNASVEVKVDPPAGLSLNRTDFAPWGIQGRYEASMVWAWDTHNTNPGAHTLTFFVEPFGYTWTEQVTLLPSRAMPPEQAAAHWASTETKCCRVYYVTNTASARDLATLTTIIDEQAQDAMEKMSASFTEPITITILPRLLGHGGFTSTEISVSYLDRNYAANSWAMVVHHEMIHAIDGHLGGDFRPTIFVEGLAVYMTGGHYKPEPLMPSAAALLPAYLNWYIPLKTLANSFYTSQHEIGYLEGASLIEYMVNTYGLDAFSSFYRDIHLHQNESQSDAIDTALKAHFSISFEQLEQNFLVALAKEPDTSTWVDDVRLTVSYYDTLRRYQQLLDPSAYFQTAWLLDNKTMRERGIVADYLRHPHAPSNLALETLFITANQQMLAQDYLTASQTLADINSVLDAIDHGMTNSFSVSPLATDYLSISTLLQQKGYEVQNINININGASAAVNATDSTSLELIPLTLHRVSGQWTLNP